MIRTKRAYSPAERADGRRVLIDRLWPRGLTRVAAHLDAWEKEVAPSEDLRRWFGHDPRRFEEFRARYRAELLRHPERLADLVVRAEHGTLTLIYAAKDEAHSNAAVLKELLEESLR